MSAATVAATATAEAAPANVGHGDGAEEVAAPGAGGLNDDEFTKPSARPPLDFAQINTNSHTVAVEDAEFLYEGEPPEPDYERIARVLANVKDEHLDLHAEMSMAVSLAKMYGGIGTVCRALGVSEASAQTVGFVGLSRISISGVRYEPAEDGPLAIIIPVSDAPWCEEQEAYDTLALLKDVPNRCWSRLGNVRCLGRWHILDAVSWAPWSIQGDNQAPVIAYPSPLEWLRGDCNGFCCLHEDWLGFETAGVPSIQPANGDVEFGRKLKRLIHEQARLPKIVIPKAAA